jgi:predicted homoserine dehydrogenase-like protein
LLDGEGGYTVWGKLLPAAKSRAIGGLPLGLAHNMALKRTVARGQNLCWDDVQIDTGTRAYSLRREMESEFADAPSPAGPPPQREAVTLR